MFAAAVAASIRHVDAPYDELLMAGLDRDEARERVWQSVQAVPARWQEP